MIIHCCNCESCQRETGTAFAENLVVEADQVEILSGSKTTANQSKEDVVKPKLIVMPSESGDGQVIARCPICFIAVWSHYSGSGPWIKFLRGGTLDKTSVDGRNVKEFLTPDMYIFTKFKQPWVVYPQSAVDNGKVKDEFYNPKEHWAAEASERFAATRNKANGWVERGRRWDVLGEVVDLRDGLESVEARLKNL